MYSSEKKVGVARSHASAVRTRKLAATRPASAGIVPTWRRASVVRGACARSAMRAATDTLRLSAETLERVRRYCGWLGATAARRGPSHRRGGGARGGGGGGGVGARGRG